MIHVPMTTASSKLWLCQQLVKGTDALSRSRLLQQYRVRLTVLKLKCFFFSAFVRSFLSWFVFLILLLEVNRQRACVYARV